MSSYILPIWLRIVPCPKARIGAARSDGASVLQGWHRRAPMMSMPANESMV